MNLYSITNPEIWNGRKSDQKNYLHEKIACIDLEKESTASASKKTMAILGYACDEGVKRNQGRVGTVQGPEAIRKMLGKLPNHLPEENVPLDAGTIRCIDGNLESSQNQLAKKVCQLLEQNVFSMVLGGGHDMAYGHYNGIKKYLKNKTIGIINFDAHFDLRNNPHGNNSGTLFYQIAQDCLTNDSSFKYLCLGIRKDANDSVLFQTAKDLKITYIENENFNRSYLEHIKETIHQFIDQVDHIYLTIDLDGFSSAHAPGVSAASPMGFSPDIVLEALKIITDSNKLISMDVTEMNPIYDRDDQTAKLAASLIHFILHHI